MQPAAHSSGGPASPLPQRRGARFDPKCGGRAKARSHSSFSSKRTARHAGLHSCFRQRGLRDRLGDASIAPMADAGQ